MGIEDLTEKDLERFWSKVDKKCEDECWNWLGILNNLDVPIFYFNKSYISCRQIIWYYVLKNFSTTNHLFTTCKNKVCCNPSHITSAYHRTTDEINEEFIENFWKKVDIEGEDDCWLWKAHINSDGYGQVRLGNMKIASRIAYIITNGNIDSNTRIMHSCDQRNCCNPKHLIAATQKDNIIDMENKNRSRHSGWQTRKWFSEEEVIDIRTMYQNNMQSKDIALKYSVTPDTIYKVRMGKTYKKYGGPIDESTIHGKESQYGY